MTQPNELERIKEQVLAQIRSVAMEIEDSTLRQETDRALKSLEDFVGDPDQFLTDANEILGNLVRLLGEYDKRRSDLRALYADLDEIQQAAATPEGLVEMLGCLDYPEARYAAIELIQATSLLAQLSRGVFVGEYAEWIREQARMALRDLLGTGKGRFQADIATLYGLGASKILRAIRRDPTGGELRQMIQEEQLNYPAIVSVAKRIVVGLQQEILTPLLQESEREMREGLLAYIVPPAERRLDDTLIGKLAKYVDPKLVIRSRLATPFEITLKRKSVPIFANFLKLSDDLARLLSLFPANLHQTDRKALGKAINMIRTTVKELHETSSLHDLSDLEDKEETERRFLLLLLRKEFLSELRKRISWVYGQVSEETPLPTDARKFFEKEIITYVEDFAQTVNELSIEELQANLAAWRRWLHRIEEKFHISETQIRPFLRFEPDSFITIEKVIMHPKHLLKVISTLKRRKRLVAIVRRLKTTEDALARLETLFTYLDKQL
ncbi:MAG: hypothetical protein ACE5I5_09220 [Candidatus Heimdallarchaeota archaeon]